MHFVACDYDGTLEKNKIVTNEDIIAIQEFQKKGNIFAICTGRPIDSVLERLKTNNIPFDYIIGVNGAIAVDSNLNLIYEHSFDPQYIKVIKEVFKTHNFNSYVISDGFDNILIANDEVNIEFKINESSVKGLYIDAITNENALKLTNSLNQELEEKGIKAYPNIIYVAVGMGGIHKGFAVNKLTNILNFKGNIHVIGDDYNDIPMFTRYNSFGIKTGAPEAIKNAKWQVGSVSEVLNSLD